GNNQDGIRPKEITVNLMAGSEKVASTKVEAGEDGKWSYSFTNLPKYKNGQEIEYSVSEVKVDGYTTEVKGYDLINTHVPDTIEIKGTKTWNDGNNQDGIRPKEITVNLMAGSEKVASTKVEAGEDGKWSYSFTNLPKYKNGQEIEYSVSEVKVDGYTTEVKGYDLINTHTPETIKIEGTKTWNDGNNQDGIRPTEITVNLLANGEEVANTKVEADEDGKWSYSFTNLPKYKNGQEIEYSVSEVKVDGYTTEVKGYDLINTHTPDQTSMKVTKAWNDNDNQDKNRPVSIEIQLFANGEEKGKPVVLSEENGWVYTWNKLDVNKDGEAINYTVQEVNVPTGYEDVVTGSAEEGYIITNNYKLGSMTVIKDVSGVSDADVEDAEADFTFVITSDNYKQEFTLPAGGNEILTGLTPGTYTIKEVKPDQAYSNESYNYLGTSYQVSGAEESVEALEGQIVVSENNRTVVTFTNEYEPVGDLKVVKIDSADDEKVLEGAEFTLTDKDGNVQTLTTDQEGVAFFENLPYGEYELAETKAPKGYIFKEGQKWTVTIDDHSVVEMPIQNTKGTPSLEVSKTTDKQEYKQGETIHYTITVKNTGDIDLEGIELKGIFSKNGDANIGQLELEGYTGPINLKIGERATYKVDYVIPKTDLADTTYTNVIIATVDDVEISDEVTVIVDPTYALEVNKEADKEEVKVGETITYTITVTNTGKHTLTNVNVVDKMVGLDTVIEKLEAGETKTFTVTHVATAEDVGELTNVAVAKVVVNCEEIVEEGSEIVKVSEQDAPALDVEKTADKSQYKPGETVTYTITITNTGNVDLKRITLKDVFSKDGDDNIDQLKLEGYDTENGFDLAVGKTATFTATYVIPETDLADTTYTNVITATVDGVEMDPVSDEATIIVDPTYALEVDKTADKEEVKVGETITYTINVTNTGNKALTDVKVVDEMVGLDTVIEKLEVGKTKTFTVKHVATTENVGELTNVAVAKVVIDGKEIVEEGSVTVTVSEEDAAVVTPDPKEPTIIEVVQNFIENPKTGQSTLNILLVLGVFLIAGSGLYVWKRKH
ncbi:Cna B-type domain-containing protein, partial [Bacillus sp. D386]|uniref:Cna B-type domain-containing protein n=1 Tax=Bacillus sp. D386 TaxID=2587155 RepID=UPI001123D090